MTKLCGEVHNSKLPARLLLYICLLFESEVVCVPRLEVSRVLRPCRTIYVLTVSTSLLAAMMVKQILPSLEDKLV